MSQTGLTYARDPFDRERYEAIRLIAAEMLAMSDPGGVDVMAVVDLLKGQVGYATPKVDMRGVVFDADGRLLLVQERSDGDKWTLPGGWADIGSSPGENVTREIREEAGFETCAVKVLAVYDRDKHDHPKMAWHTYKLFVRCEITGGTAAEGGTSETSGVGFFGLDEIPLDLSTERATAAQLARMFEHFRRPDLATDFD